MLDFLFQPGYDTQVTIAAWATVAAAVTTLVLIAYTLGLRAATVLGEHRRRAVVSRWRGAFADTMMSDTRAREAGLPRVSRRHRTDILEEWNGLRVTVEGDAVDNLIVAAHRLGLHRLAGRMLGRRRLHTRLLAVETLGNMRDAAHWEQIAALLDHPNTALSVTAARAIAQIDRRRAVDILMPLVISRADWPQTTAARILKLLGPDLVTQPISNAILTGKVDTVVRLLRFGDLLRSEALERLLEELIRERREPAILSAALKICPDQCTVPRIGELVEHEAWYVRMQAARLLGRVGQPRDVPMLERMLTDPEWWVRYRAAQSLVLLPFMGPGAMRALRGRQTDRYARDMVGQAMAEAGLE